MGIVLNILRLLLHHQKIFYFSHHQSFMKNIGLSCTQMVAQVQLWKNVKKYPTHSLMPLNVQNVNLNKFQILNNLSQPSNFLNTLTSSNIIPYTSHHLISNHSQSCNISHILHYLTIQISSHHAHQIHIWVSSIQVLRAIQLKRNKNYKKLYIKF